MTLDIGAARVNGPWRIADLALDQGIILGSAGTDGDVGLAFRQVEDPIADHEFHAQTRVACVERIDQPRLHQTTCEALLGGHTECAGEAHVAGGQIAREGHHGRLDAVGRGRQCLSQFRQFVAGEMARQQFTTEAPLKLGDTPLHRRLIDPKRLRRRQQTTGAGEREEVSQVVPGEHRLTLQFRGRLPQCRGSRRSVGQAYFARARSHGGLDAGGSQAPAQGRLVSVGGRAAGRRALERSQGPGAPRGGGGF